VTVAIPVCTSLIGHGFLSSLERGVEITLQVLSPFLFVACVLIKIEIEI
jgi:hypothetical protein